KQPATDSLGDPLPEHALLRLGTTRFHSPSGVNDMALSPAGDIVVTVGSELVVWDAKTGKELFKASTRECGLDNRGPGYGLESVAFDPNGRYFLTPGKQNEVIQWDVASGKRQSINISGAQIGNQLVRGQENVARAVELAADGRTLAVGSPWGVIVCDINNGQAQFQVANQITGPIDHKQFGKDRLLFYGHYSFGRFSPDGSTFAVVTSGSPNEIVLFNLVNGEELRHIALKDRLVRLAFSPDGKQIATTEHDKAVRLYRVADGKELWSHIVKLTNPIENYTSAIAYSPDGKLIAAGATDNHIHLLDPANGNEVAALSGGMYYPWGVAFTPDSKILFSSGWDGAVRRWDVAARKQLPLPAGVHATSVTAASPDGKTIAYQDDAGTIRLVRTQGGAEYDRLEHPDTHYSQLLFSPDGSQLAGGGTTGKNVHITIWNLRDKKFVHRLEWPKGKDSHSEVESLSFTPDGQRIAAAVFRQNASYLFDLKTEKQIAKMKHGEVYGLSFSPDGKTLATAGWDKYIRFWDAQT
ncbi:MAG TPA: WD40 repeat domain-containing protein, partial [Planctomycetaceae bacterium]